ncbi:MarR family winged helix-turn-helix transcriptional regulator [Paracoccus sp. (in: a-proteobacteria)]|uniref:MarR family winged helix-turn-helix transcriptional regulator n=1 Tax=Paracoccus sp. TaxID=267 RepID=UPI003A8A9FF2
MNAPRTIGAEQADPDLGQLVDSLGFLLRLAQLGAFGLFYERLAQTGVKPGEYSVLYVIRRNPGIRQGVLAQRLLIKRAHMTKLIRHLEGQSLIARHIPDDDRRAVELTLTQAGETLVAAHEQDMLDQAGHESERLTGDEARQLIGLLRKFTGIEERT